MSEPSHTAAARSVARAGPVALLGAGRRAFGEVPGLRWFLLKGFVLLYAVFIAVGGLTLGLVYRYAVQPLSQRMASYDVGGGFWLDLLFPLLSALLWLGQALLLSATLLLSFVIALSLLSVWFEALAARIVAHRRGGAADAGAFSLGLWLRSLGRALRDNVLLLALAVLALLAGFVPLLGPFLVFALTSYVMGWEVREPYLAVRAEGGETLPALRKGLTWWTLWVGTLPVLIAMVPLLGWVLLPVVLTYQAAGVAWLSEEPA